MRFLATLIAMIVVLTGGYLLYQTEAIHSLLEPSAPREKDPLAFLDEVEVTPQPEPQETARPQSSNTAPAANRTRSATRPAVASEPQPSAPPEVPNDQVARVLLGVLKAQGLAYGISLSVTDRELSVDGEVDSEEQRQKIIQIVNKGRGRRILKADYLIVKSPE